MTASARAAQVRLATALIFITPAMWSVNYLVARWAIGRDRTAHAGAWGAGAWRC